MMDQLGDAMALKANPVLVSFLVRRNKENMTR